MVAAVSDRYRAAARTSHEVVVTADAMLSGQVIATGIPVSGGNVTADRGQWVRRTCNITVPDRSLIPEHATSPLAPYGQELRIRRGIRFADGTTEWVTLGVFGIQETRWEPVLGAVAVTGADRMQRLVDAKSNRPYALSTIYTGADSAGRVPVMSAVNSMFIHTFLDMSVGIDWDAALDLDMRTPRGMFVDTDPWEDVAVPCLRAMGAEAYVGTDGRLKVVPVPDVRTATPVWVVDAGPTGVMVSAHAAMSRVGVANIVTVYSNQIGDAAPVSAMARDTDPESPTYAYLAVNVGGTVEEAELLPGPFGRANIQIRSEAAQAVAQCQREADAYLRNNLGIVRSVDFTALPAEFLEPGDAVTVAYPDGSAEKHLLDTTEVGLAAAAGAMTATTRAWTRKLPEDT